MKDASTFGWTHREGDSKQTHDWTELVSLVQGHIAQLNFSYAGALHSDKVEYLNMQARQNWCLYLTEMCHFDRSVQSNLT